MSTKVETGSVTWNDLTVENAEEVREFYSKVVGWKYEEVKMGNYSDFSMLTPSEGKAVAGICHARGVNAGLPPQWLIYITVDDIEKSIKNCIELGGSLIAGPKNMGEQGRYCVIKDPAGAVAALFQFL
ncbi:MAG: VOC family protein [Ignavibacteriales bacterium]|nr:MAG: VOC family protein [Ignavibacteriales bacterium]